MYGHIKTMNVITHTVGSCCIAIYCTWASLPLTELLNFTDYHYSQVSGIRLRPFAEREAGANIHLQNKVEVNFVGWCCRESMKAYLTLLTLSAHAQQGLQQYVVCFHPSVHRFVTSFSATALKKAVNK